MKPSSENWLKIARYDLKVAHDNFKSGNNMAAIEKCHNSLEKLLKGIISENKQQPSKVHDLLRLCSEALIINLQSDVQDLFQELNSIYMTTRYPDEFDLIQERLDKERTEKILKETKKIFLWLEKKLKKS